MSSQPPPVLAVSHFNGFEDPRPTSRWLPLFSEIRSRGITFWNDQTHLKPTHWVAIDYNKVLAKRMAFIPRTNRLLVCVEPGIVNPLQYSWNVLSSFSEVIATSSRVTKVSSPFRPIGGRFNPSYRPNDFFSNNGERTGIIMLNQNKFSFVSTSNYALRSRFVRHAHARGMELSVGGLNWSRGYIWSIAQQIFHAAIALRACERPALSQFVLPLRKSSQYRILGRVLDELELLSRYRICVVIENESSYVSEKIYRALKAGCQCVYVGPPLDADAFPQGFFHQAEASVTSICESIESAATCNYLIDSHELQNWTQNSEFARQQSSCLQISSVLDRILEWTGPKLS